MSIRFLVSSRLSKIDGNDDIKYCVPYEIEHKEIKKGFFALKKNFFNSMHLNLLAHGDHKLGFTPVFEEKGQITPAYVIELFETQPTYFC